MITAVSHSLGADYIDLVTGERGERIMHKKTFKRYGLRCKLYIFIQIVLEDYVEIFEETEKIGGKKSNV